MPLPTARDQKRKAAELSLEVFINTVHPLRLLGQVHRDVINWWTGPSASSHQLLLMPRDHMKSALIAYRVAWELTKDPTLRILYISSTANLAIKQLKFIKDILTCDNYTKHWPDMVIKEEAKREKWTEKEISVDDPRRKAESIRDPSIFTAGLTSNIVGMHCDIAVMDDVVVSSTAYTEEGRNKVKDQYGLLASVEAFGAREWIVGTRYHPKDLYNDLMEMEIDQYDERGDVHTSDTLFDKREYVVEDSGDGTGQFLWPKQRRADGKWFGFDEKELAKKRAQYINKIHFRAQYYNDPQDIDSSPIQRDAFQYYDQNYISKRDSNWVFRNERLNVVAAVDFAYSTGKKSDFTCIVVLGVDGSNNYYILDIDRFKTDRPSEYFARILKLYEKWGFRRIRAEVTAAQSPIVQDFKENYIRRFGLSLVVDEYRPTRWIGNKQERILAILEPKYANKQMFHYTGGNIQALEEELIFTNPAHDDIKDALASAVDFAIPPTNYYTAKRAQNNGIQFHGRFGGAV